MSIRSSARSTATRSRAPLRLHPQARISPAAGDPRDTGEVLHIRLRKGSANTSRGMLRFCDELIARVDRAGATGPKLLRADSGFWAKQTFARLRPGGLAVLDRGPPAAPSGRSSRRSPRTRGPRSTDYPEDRRSRRSPKPGSAPSDDRPARPHALPQGELLPSWEHYPFATNRSDALALVESEHRQHAVVELAIRDLKDQALAHFPSGKFTANAAWTVIAALAHNLLRWTQTDRPPRHHHPDRADPAPPAADDPRPPCPLRTPHLLRMPARWPWQTEFPPRSTPPGTATTRLTAAEVTTSTSTDRRPRPARKPPSRLRSTRRPQLARQALNPGHHPTQHPEPAYSAAHAAEPRTIGGSRFRRRGGPVRPLPGGPRWLRR